MRGQIVRGMDMQYSVVFFNAIVEWVADLTLCLVASEASDIYAPSQ